MYQAKSGVKNFSLYWDRVPPLKIWDLGPPLPKIWDLGPPPQSEQTDISKYNKKVLLCEHKRHTARRVAIAISCYSRGGGPSTKNFFPSLNMYQAKSGVKNFSLYLGEGSLDKKFFPSLNMYQAKSGVKNFSLYWGGVPWQKIFFRSEHVSSQIWCQKFFPLLRPGTPPPENLRPGTPPLNLRPGTPPKIWDLGPPPKNLRPGTPPPKVNRRTFPSINITFPPTTYAGGKYYLPSYYVRGR